MPLHLASVFQAVSLEGWSDLLHMLAVSSPIASPLYFICLVVFGAFFVLQLYVVVMMEAYLATSQQLAEEAEQRCYAPSRASAVHARKRCMLAPMPAPMPTPRRSPRRRRSRRKERRGRGW